MDVIEKNKTNRIIDNNDALSFYDLYNIILMEKGEKRLFFLFGFLWFYDNNKIRTRRFNFFRDYIEICQVITAVSIVIFQFHNSKISILFKT